MQSTFQTGKHMCEGPGAERGVANEKRLEENVPEKQTIRGGETTTKKMR
jgi:hypothetical protein